MSLNDLYINCPNAKNLEQINSAIKQIYKYGDVGRIREGKQYVYFWKHNSAQTTGVVNGLGKPQAPMVAPNITVSPTVKVDDVQLPDIIVSANKVVVITKHARITVET